MPVSQRVMDRHSNMSLYQLINITCTDIVELLPHFTSLRSFNSGQRWKWDPKYPEDPGSMKNIQYMNQVTTWAWFQLPMLSVLHTNGLYASAKRWSLDIHIGPDNQPWAHEWCPHDRLEGKVVVQIWPKKDNNSSETAPREKKKDANSGKGSGIF